MTEFKTWFDKESRLVKIILLLIPFVNWLVELCIRWTVAIKGKDNVNFVIAIVFTFFGLVLGWVDLIWVLLFDRLIFVKK